MLWLQGLTVWLTVTNASHALAAVVAQSCLQTGVCENWRAMLSANTNADDRFPLPCAARFFVTLMVSRRGSLPRASAKYRRLNELALGVVRPGGVLMTCSCSGAMTQSGGLGKVVAEAAVAAERQVRLGGLTL